MPIYEYECEQCGVRFERLQRMVEPSLTDCPECGGHIHRVMQPVGVIFKGSGFYVTDHKGKSSTAIPGKKDDEAKPASTTTGDEPAAPKTETKSTTESKSAAADS